MTELSKASLEVRLCGALQDEDDLKYLADLFNGNLEQAKDWVRLATFVEQLIAERTEAQAIQIKKLREALSNTLTCADHIRGDSRVKYEALLIETEPLK
jgi:hypothetical protein